MMPMVRPAILAHADWSCSPSGRVVAVATARPSGYELVHLTRRPDPGTLLAELARDGGLLGLDLPIGVPVAWARRAGLRSFPHLLDRWGTPPWDRLGEPAAAAEEIDPYRPFYPRRPGGARQEHVLRGLGVDRLDQLRRRCERAPPLHRPAAPLFWTLGPNQVGKAALAGWTELVIPARRAGATLWPFDGDLGQLVAGGGVALAETYPAACYGALGVAFGPHRSKRRQADRAAVAPAVVAAARRAGLALPSPFRSLVRDGFGTARGGDDALDALVGLIGLLLVVTGDLPATSPPDEEVRRWEGWILGVAP